MARIIDVIKYEGDNNTFIWKHPREDFNALSQLVVHESQEAIFFLNGEALDLFGPGRYTLESQNLPLLSKLLKTFTGRDSAFHCEVYFINKTVQMAIKWGTPELVHFVEPTYGIPLGIGASGELNLMVEDSRKLLVKLVGTTKGIAWDERGMGFTKSIQSSFRPLITTAVKTYLANVIVDQGIDLFEIDSRLTDLSEGLRQAINPGFEEYGLTIPEFYVTTINLPENDPNFKKMRELRTIALQTKVVEAETSILTAKVEAETTVLTAKAESEAAVAVAKRKAILEEQTTETEIAKQKAERELIQAQTKAQAQRLSGVAEADVMRAKGYNQRDVIQADVQKAYAEGLSNMGSSGVAGGATTGMVGEFVNLGVGLAAAGQVSSHMGEMFKGFVPQDPTTDTQASCHKCGALVSPNAKFCPECGSKIEVVLANEVICPSCGAKTQKGKFCLECGAPLVKICSCGCEVPDGAKFCPECGQKL